MKSKSSLTFLLLIFLAVAVRSQNAWPTKSWPLTTAKAVNLNADSLIALDKGFENGDFGYVDGMLIIRHGKIAYEKSYKHDYADIYKAEAKEKSGLNYSDPTGPYNYFNAWWHPFYHNTQLHSLQSVSKTITSIIIGIAIERKEFPDINTPMLSFFDTSSVKNIDDRKRRITIRHLLTMTAGFEWHENLPYSDPKNSGMIMEASLDWAKYTIDQPMADEPGKVFNYNSGSTQILAHIFRVATGKDIEEYAVKYLFEPLGIKNHFWKRSLSGLVDSEGGVYLEKSDLAKIFFLYLKNGKWENKQLVSPEWIKESVAPFIKLSPSLSYGYKWWLTTYGNKPSEIAWGGNGFGGQFPVIIPEYDMVVVFTAWNIKPGKSFRNYQPNYLINKILHSIEEYNKANK